MTSLRGLMTIALATACAALLGSATTIGNESDTALAGFVSAHGKAPLEGVLVTARRTSSTMSTTVVSRLGGRYEFSRDSLAPGRYALTIRAAGYDLAGPAFADVPSGQPARVDIRLRPTTDVASQLTDADWLRSMPGSYDQKRDLNDCDSCHSISVVARSHYTAADFLTRIIPRMRGYTNNSSFAHPQRRGADRPLSAQEVEAMRPFADYLARINLSRSPTWSYPLQTAPRPRGPETHVVITTYDLPRRDIAPHDVVLDAKGRVFYSSFHEQFIGQLDPRTGAVTEFAIPLLKPGFPTGSLDLEVDPVSNALWLAMMYQGALLRFDPDTHAITTWMLPPALQDDATQIGFLTVPSRADGKMWVKESGRRITYRFDPSTGTFEPFGPPKAPDGHIIPQYGIYADSGNNVYGLEFPSQLAMVNRSHAVTRLDAVSGTFSTIPTPTHESRGRRGSFDGEDRLWFAEFDGNAIAQLDVKTRTIVEWPLPDPFTFPYDAERDSTGKVWTGSMFTDRVVRLDPASGRTVSYLLPQSANIRRIFVDNRARVPSLWIGSNHGGAILRVTPTQ